MNREYVVRDFGDRTEANAALKREKDQWHSVSLIFDSGLPDCQRRVLAVSLFHPKAEPSNPVKWGLPDPNSKTARRAPLADDQANVLAQVKDKMDLHRALLRGQGFLGWMTKRPPQSIEAAAASLSLNETTARLRPLPVVNFLDLPDPAHAEAIVKEALPQDEDRLRGYLSNRPLGVGIIAAVSPYLSPLMYELTNQMSRAPALERPPQAQQQQQLWEHRKGRSYALHRPTSR